MQDICIEAEAFQPSGRIVLIVIACKKKKKGNRHNSMMDDVSVSLLPSRWCQWRPGLFLVFDINLTFLLLLRRLRETKTSFLV